MCEKGERERKGEREGERKRESGFVSQDVSDSGSVRQTGMCEWWGTGWSGGCEGVEGLYLQLHCFSN